MTTNLIASRSDIVDKYNTRGSYCTSYPPAGAWQEGHSHSDLVGAMQDGFTARPDRALQLYLHFPFCRRQCWYCQCHQMVARESVRQEFMGYFLQEIELLAAFFRDRHITSDFREVHFGGGSPSHMTRTQSDATFSALRSLFDIATLDEAAIEIDPRTVTNDDLRYYREQGITRISFGVQDVDPDVQRAINRVQPVEMVERLLESRHLFRSVNFDMIYGLPRQTRASAQATVSKVIDLRPDRVAYSVLGHRPDVFPHNAKIRDRDLPSIMDRTLMWEDALAAFTACGYERVGMDLFVRPTDALAVAQRNHTMFRNAMGFSPGRFEDNIAIGPSGMTRFGDYYFQNAYALDEYYAAVAAARFPVFRGYHLTGDDKLRRAIINQIMSYFAIDIPAVEAEFGIRFASHFAAELDELRRMEQDGLLEISPTAIRATPLGCYSFCLRHVCGIFDNLGKPYQHNIESGDKRRRTDTAAQPTGEHGASA